MASAWDNTNPELANSVRGLIAESGGRINIVSGFRSPERQQQLWAEALRKYGSADAARKWVAPPGNSHHEKGEAFDLGGDLQLAHLLAPKYGLTFPMGHEPWHIERSGLKATTGAYTTPPQEQTGDHVDSMFKKLGDVFGGFDVSQLGEFDPTQMKTASDAGADLSGATADNGKTATGGIDAFMAAISGQESGGNYGARNTDSGASGKYQIMPNNWPSWSREAGLPANSAMTPENQERVARFKMQSYYDQFGNWRDVAKAWYGGPGAVRAKNGNASQGAYPTINSYADTVVSRMGG